MNERACTAEMATAVPDGAQEVLRRVFGYPEFRPNQAEIVHHVVAGGDAFVLMPTGGGKSLCYQIPAILRVGVGVVVSPLISLMKDQVDALQVLGVAAARLDSSLEPGEARDVLNRLRGMRGGDGGSPGLGGGDPSRARAGRRAGMGRLDLLYVSPERLMTEGMLELLSTIPLALFAIDEAHCV
ncbi:MAG: DEAD/DEAH box helicase, partial [Thermoleophilia bacterium]|nr:DEAD/DEAH box helicase [Thermoleophilia bacterium]